MLFEFRRRSDRSVLASDVLLGLEELLGWIGAAEVEHEMDVGLSHPPRGSAVSARPGTTGVLHQASSAQASGHPTILASGETVDVNPG